VGEFARARFCTGIAKLCNPLAYGENALELAELLRRGGDLALTNLDVDPSMGDFDRETEEKGDEADAKVSKPERLVTGVEGDVEDSPGEGKVGKGDTGIWLMGKSEGDVDGLLDEKIF